MTLAAARETTTVVPPGHANAKGPSRRLMADAQSHSFGDDEFVLDDLTGSLGFLSRAAYLQIGELIRAHGAFSVSPPTLSMLALVRANPGIRQVHAARLLLIHESNMAILVRELVRKGLVQRQKGGGRRSGLWITEEGTTVLAQTIQATAVSREYADDLSDEEYLQLITLLSRIYRARL